MKFADIIGNNDIKIYLNKSIENKNILHSYLFLGNSGIGKLIFAKEFARKILCFENTKEECTCKSCTCFNGKNHPDFYLINENGENIKVDTIRNLTEKVIEKPIISNKKVYIINDCEKMTKEAQNCLLKTLEEPPEFVVIILISSNENLILNTIKSRCMSIKFHNIEDRDLILYAKNKLGYTNISNNFLKSFDGSIGKMIKLKDFKEKYDKIDLLISDILKKALIEIMLDGKIRKMIKLKNFKEKYDKIDLLISDILKKDLIEIMLDGKILYDKENIYDILDYIIVCLYSKKEENEKYLNCIRYVNECELRLKSNSNFDMSIDNLLFKMWEELNERSNRS